MWMQRSMEGASINAPGGYGERPGAGGFGGNPYERSGRMTGYGGGGPSHDSDDKDWKQKIMEGGQWLGGKVIEYGGKLARGNSHDSIPDHMMQQPRNDGRANWMADIRNSSSSFSGGGMGSYHGNCGGNMTYQNDFATERPSAYSDYSRNSAPGSSFGPSSATPSYGNRRASSPRRRSSKDHSRKDKVSHHSKKKSDSSKKKKKSKRRNSSDSEASASESEVSSRSEVDGSSEEEASDDSQYHNKSKPRIKKKLSKSQGRWDSDEEEEEPDTSSRKSMNKPPTDSSYKFAFDPAKLPPPPADSTKNKKKHSSSSKSKSKKSSKGRHRKQSIESSDSDVQPHSDKENRKSKTKKKHSNANSDAATGSVDLIGVDMGSPATCAASGPAAPSNELLSSVFDAPVANTTPMQDLAGLTFDSSMAQQPTSAPPSIFAPPADAAEGEEGPRAVPFQSSLLPEGDIVDLDALSGKKKRSSKPDPKQMRTLNDLQRTEPQQSNRAMIMNPPMTANQGPASPMPLQQQEMMAMQMGNSMSNNHMPMNSMSQVNVMQMSQMGPMNTVNRTNPMGQMSQMGHLNQMGSMGQMNPMNPINQMTQMQTQQQPMQIPMQMQPQMPMNVGGMSGGFSSQ